MMYPILYALFLLIHPVLSENSTDTNSLRVRLRSTLINLVDSFKNFTKNVKTYFGIPVEVISESKKNFMKHQLPQYMEEPISVVTYKSNESTSVAVGTNLRKTAVVGGQSHRRHSALKPKRRAFILRPEKLTPDMIMENGYRVEIHPVKTTDGYQLLLHRIPARPRIKATKIALLHHGLLGSSDDWLLLGANKSLPYLLSDAGYDVWLANARGNRYSRVHYSKPAETSSHEFWNFSWHEIGHYDLPAVIDYIRDVTEGSAQIDFVGHSMGATALLVLLTTLPMYNAMLRCAILLAPLSFMYTSRGPLRDLAELTQWKGRHALSFLGVNEYMKNETYPESLLKKFCVGDEELCSNPLLFLSNGGKNIANETLKRKILEYVPAGGSAKTIMHYCQLLRSGHFQMYDFGIPENVKKYGVRSPPMYRLNDVTIPVVVFTASDDWLSTTSDVLSLMPNMPFALQHHIIKKRDFSHTDFVFSERARKLVYCHVLFVLDTILSDRPAAQRVHQKGKSVIYKASQCN